MAMLVVLSSSSFMIGMHICSGSVKDVAVFSRAEQCENERKLPPCHPVKDTCCQDETVVHGGEDFSYSTADFNSSTPFVAEIERHRILIAELIPSMSAQLAHSAGCDPPLPADNLVIRHRVLLI